MQQNTREWLLWRKSKIGASDAPIVMGVSPWKTPQQLWKEKVSDTIETFTTAAMLRGQALEPTARVHLEKELGIKLNPEVMTHKDYDFIVASLDGVSEDGKTVVEIKCPSEFSHNLAKKGDIADHYKVQMQHQMAVTGVDSVIYYSFDGSTGVQIKYDRDQDMIDSIIEEEKKFYKCMVDKIEPIDTSLRTDKEWVEATEQWKELQVKKKELEEAERECRDRLLYLAKDKNVHGNGLALTKVERKGAVDYSKIAVLKTLDLDFYRKEPSTHWRITLK
jgi:putative phage-type endonuclease